MIDNYLRFASEYANQAVVSLITGIENWIQAPNRPAHELINELIDQTTLSVHAIIDLVFRLCHWLMSVVRVIFLIARGLWPLVKPILTSAVNGFQSLDPSHKLMLLGFIAGAIFCWWFITARIPQMITGWFAAKFRMISDFFLGLRDGCLSHVDYRRAQVTDTRRRAAQRVRRMYDSSSERVQGWLRTIGRIVPWTVGGIAIPLCWWVLRDSPILTSWLGVLVALLPVILPYRALGKFETALPLQEAIVLRSIQRHREEAPQNEGVLGQVSRFLSRATTAATPAATPTATPAAAIAPPGALPLAPRRLSLTSLLSSGLQGESAREVVPKALHFAHMAAAIPRAVERLLVVLLLSLVPWTRVRSSVTVGFLIADATSGGRVAQTLNQGFLWVLSQYIRLPRQAPLPRFDSEGNVTDRRTDDTPSWLRVQSLLGSGLFGFAAKATSDFGSEGVAKAVHAVLVLFAMLLPGWIVPVLVCGMTVVYPLQAFTLALLRREERLQRDLLGLVLLQTLLMLLALPLVDVPPLLPFRGGWKVLLVALPRIRGLNHARLAAETLTRPHTWRELGGGVWEVGVKLVTPSVKSAAEPSSPLRRQEGETPQESTVLTGALQGETTPSLPSGKKSSRRNLVSPSKTAPAALEPVVEEPPASEELSSAEVLSGLPWELLTPDQQLVVSRRAQRADLGAEEEETKEEDLSQVLSPYRGGAQDGEDVKEVAPTHVDTTSAAAAAGETLLPASLSEEEGSVKPKEGKKEGVKKQGSIRKRILKNATMDEEEIAHREARRRAGADL